MAADRVRPNYDYYVDRFQEHYRDTYAPTDYDYRGYEPAYRFGYDLAVAEPDRGVDWVDVEADARRRWDREYQDRRWDDYQDAIRHAWYEVHKEV